MVEICVFSRVTHPHISCVALTLLNTDKDPPAKGRFGAGATGVRYHCFEPPEHRTHETQVAVRWQLSFDYCFYQLLPAN